MKKKTKIIKVRDLKPKKDAKGGATHNVSASRFGVQQVAQSRNVNQNQSHSQG